MQTLGSPQIVIEDLDFTSDFYLSHIGKFTCYSSS